MGTLLFLRQYFTWHYGKAPAELFTLFTSYLKFVYHFFSLPLMVRTWISPLFQRREEGPVSVTDIEALLMALFGNLILRIVGFIFRTFVIIVGIITELCVIVFFILLFAVWITFPIIITLLVANAVRLLW